MPTMKKIDFENSLGLIIKSTSKSLERALDVELRGQHGLSQKDLAERIFVDSTTLVPIIDGMEKKGLVERRTDPKDRRNNNVFLTAKSESFVDPIIEIILRMRKIFFKNIPESDLESAKNILKKISANADSYLAKREDKIQQLLQ